MVKRRVSLCLPMFAVTCVTAGANAEWVDFVNQTGTRLSAATNVGSGNVDEKDFAWADVDLDGDIDLVAVYKIGWTNPGGRRNVLFMNEGGVLVDRTNQYATHSSVPSSQGFLDLTNDRDVQLVDLNGDGWLDVVTATTLSGAFPKYISHPRVYINRKNDTQGNWLGFTFDDENRVPTMPAEPRFCSVSYGDIDGDGDMDLYLGDYQQGGSRPIDLNDRLWINNGLGYFTDQSSTRMTAEMLESSFAMSTAIVDMNMDGHPDILKDDALNAPQGVSISYNNPANPGFFNVYTVPYTITPYNIIVGDLNNDLKPDVVVTDDAYDRYMLHTGNSGNVATFQTKVLTGSQPSDFGGNNRIADFNNDGFNDVFICDVDVDIAGCSRYSKIYRNFGNVPSVTLQHTSNCGIASADMQGNHDAAIFDLDQDGWNDLILGNCDGVRVYMNVPPAGIVFNYPLGLPTLLVPDTETTFRVSVSASGGGTPQPGTGKIYISINGGPFTETAMTQIVSNIYEAELPARPCLDDVKFYFSAQLTTGAVFYDPAEAAAAPYSAVVASGIDLAYVNNFEGSVTDWTVVNEAGLTAGAWVAVDPNGTIFNGEFAAPEDDAEASANLVKCFVTMNGPPGGAAGSYDVDGGITRLLSPTINLAASDANISYFRWVFCDDFGGTGADALTVEVSNNGGGSWTLVESVGDTDGWEARSFRVSDFVAPTANVRVRFSIGDSPNNSLTEGGIDLFQVEQYMCEEPCVCMADLSGDGRRDGGDVQYFVDCLLGGGTGCNCGDHDGNGSVGPGDISGFVAELINNAGVCP